MAASVTGCSLVAPGLVHDVLGQTPTFSYRRLFHSDDYFGVQAVYMSGFRTCYGGKPTFIPYITNSAAGFSRDCSWNYAFIPPYTALLCSASVTDIPDGPLTINYRGAVAGSNSPLPFTAQFGPAPTAAIVTQTAFVTSNTIASTTAAPLPASTVTVTQTGNAVTSSLTVQVTQPKTSTNTITFTSCPTSSSASVPSSSSSLPAPASSSSSTSSSAPAVSSSVGSSSSSSPAPAPTSSPAPAPTSSPGPAPASSSASPSPVASSSSAFSSPSPSLAPSSSTVVTSLSVASSSSSVTPVASAMPTCPNDNGTVFSTTNGDFIIECFSDRYNNDIGVASPQPANYAMCMNACAQTSGCVAVSYIPNGSCYLKNGLGAQNSNNNVWGARKASGTSSATTTSSSSPAVVTPATTSSAVATPTTTSSAAVTPVTTSSAVVAPSSSTSTAAPAASAVSCPGSDGQTIVTSVGTFIVECYTDRAGYDMDNSPVYPGTYEGCVATCANRPGCQDVSYNPGGPCYLKNGVGTAGSNSNVWGGRLVSSSSTSTSTPAASSSPASATSSSVSVPAITTTPTNTPVSSTVSCPGSDGQVIDTSVGSFVVECSTDRNGFDMANSPVYPGSYEGCLNACASRSGCQDVSYNPGGPCYLKNGVGNPSTNSNVIGGRLLSSGMTATSVSQSATTVPVSSSMQSAVAPSSSAPAANPAPAQTITVTTTVSGTGYQCACTPTSTLASASATPTISAQSISAPSLVTCPDSNEANYTSECGATYAIECGADRHGNDFGGIIPQVNSLNECLKACDKMAGCVDVSYVAGTPGPCYMKNSIGAIRQTSNVWGGRLISGCTTPSKRKIKLHRKGVVHKPAKKPIQKRGIPYGPDFTFLGGGTSTITKTSTTFAVVSTTTVIPPRFGATTTTVYTTARVTSTVTQTVASTVVTNTTVTTCPRPTVF